MFHKERLLTKYYVIFVVNEKVQKFEIIFCCNIQVPYYRLMQIVKYIQ